MKRLAMIGCERIGSYHLDHLLQMDGRVELAGFCDLVPEKAELFRRRAGSGRAFTDFRQMYDEVRPDMVFICVPPFAHGDIEDETIRRGIHFFVEKPVSLDEAFARRTADRVKKAGLITAVGFQCRYSILIEPLKAFLAGNEVRLVEASRVNGVPEMPWWPYKNKSGGMLVESAIHQLDLIRWLFDEPAAVCTFGEGGALRRQGYDIDEVTTTIIRFRGGALGVMSAGCYATEGASFDSKITFSAGEKRAVHRIIETLDFHEKDEDAEGGIFVTKGDGVLSKKTKTVTLRQENDAGLDCDRTFVEAVLSGDASAIRCDYADGVKSLIFALACNRSAETGVPVEVAY